MVQFVFTPWRNRAELLGVRQQLFPASSTDAASASASSSAPWPWTTPTELHDMERAIARVFMWVHRGGCPHVVESTALLMAAIVFDARGPHDAVAQAAVVGGYLVGFTRFVTGLLDSHQDKARKLSMYGVAKTIGLPASFVELRHQGTHEPMPSLTQLRPAARRALVWIWEYYWRNLPEENEGIGGGSGPATSATSAAAIPTATATATAASLPPKSSLQERMCRSALLGFLQRQEGAVGEAATEGLMRQLRTWDGRLVITTLADIGETTRDGGMLLRSVKLARTILGTTEVRDGQEADADADETALKQELVMARDEVERVGGEGPQRSIWARATGKRKKQEDEDEEAGQDAKRSGWFKQKGPWVAKPIGVL